MSYNPIITVNTHINDTKIRFKVPFGFGGGDSNLYGYVLGDSVGGIDPMGLFDLSCYGDCIEERRWDLWKYAIPFTPVHKKMLPPFRVPKKSQPWTSPYSAGLYQLKKLNVPTKIRKNLRKAGRYVGQTLFMVDGIHDWYLIVDCAIDCQEDSKCE